MKMMLILLGIQFVFYFLTFILKTKKNLARKRNILFALIQIIIFYFSLLIIVKIIDLQLEKELYSFDLNGDGIFSGDEITPEQEKAMRNYIGDAGRTLAPITGAVYSLLYFPIAIGIEFLIDWIVKKIKA